MLCDVKWGGVSLLLQTNRKSLIEGILHFYDSSLLCKCFLVFIVFKIPTLLSAQHTCPLTCMGGSWINESKLFAAKFNWKSVGIGTGSIQK